MEKTIAILINATTATFMIQTTKNVIKPNRIVLSTLKIPVKQSVKVVTHPNQFWLLKIVNIAEMVAPVAHMILII